MIPHLKISQNILKRCFEESAKESNLKLDVYFLKFLFLPLRLHLSSLLNQTDTFPKSNPQLTQELSFYSSSSFALNLKFEIFLLIQIISGLIQNKNLLLEFILKITGIYQNSNPNLKTLHLIVLIFIITLVVDRTNIFDQKESFLADIIHSILFPNQVSAQTFYQFIPQSFRNDSILDQIISRFVSIHQSDSDYVFLLKNFTSMKIYSSHIYLSKILQYLTRHSEKFPTKLLQIPDVEGDPFGLDLISLLTCSTNFQLIYSVLFDYHFENSLKSQESVFVIFDQLRLISRFKPFSLSKTEFPKISVNSIHDLHFDSFEEAFQTPISIKKYPFYSLFHLIINNIKRKIFIFPFFIILISLQIIGNFRN
jgi:hypothetical protein